MFFRISLNLLGKIQIIDILTLIGQAKITSRGVRVGPAREGEGEGGDSQDMECWVSKKSKTCE